MNADQKSLETVFSIAICRQSGDKWQSKTLFLTIFDLRSITCELCMHDGIITIFTMVLIW